MTDPMHDRIEQFLREDARRHLADDGFSLRVASSLPPETATRAWLKHALVLGSAAIGSVLAWLFAPAGTSLVQGFLDLARLHAHTPSAFAALGLALAMAVTAAVLVAEEN
ncbi:MAG TPA: hypothetical protein VFV55_10220 [Usitatibacteraceae bacterium]|nr:hypothetical protein [Usitatibacteraceae bacterium]